jgi:hypothetical protein
MNRIILSMVAILLSLAVLAQEVDTDLPENTGDNFSLEGALALFKKSTSLEDFEKMLNDEANNVNNLDLNGDGDIDYIVVNAMREGDTHAIVLSTFLNEKEQQDIAVIGIEKLGSESARLQIEGDADLYADNTIIEPKEEGESMIRVQTDDMVLTDGYDQQSTFIQSRLKYQNGPSDVFYSSDMIVLNARQVFVNVWFWPGVRFVYAPGYVVWRSPWRWGWYPKWWRPWRPVGHRVFFGRCSSYRVIYHRVPSRRVVVAHRLYAPRRNHSTIIVHKNRRSAVIVKPRAGRGKAVRVKRGRGRRP